MGDKSFTVPKDYDITVAAQLKQARAIRTKKRRANV